MATPGYPQAPMGQMPMTPMTPMTPMAGGGMSAPRPMRRGTSKAVPVVVSAGLAVGVFCGLLFGVGTGKKNANAAPPSASNVKKTDEADKGAAPAGLGATTAMPVATGSAAKPATTPTTPTGTGSASGSATPTVAQGSAAPTTTTPTTPTTPEVKKVKVTIKVVPDTAQGDAKIKIDGVEITGNTTEIPADKKSVKVEIEAKGYRTAEKKLDLIGDEMTLEIPLQKHSSGGTGGTVHPPHRPDRPPSNSGGGLIDI